MFDILFYSDVNKIILSLQLWTLNSITSLNNFLSDKYFQNLTIRLYVLLFLTCTSNFILIKYYLLFDL